MIIEDKTKDELMEELVQLRKRIAELERPEMDRSVLREHEGQYRTLFNDVPVGLYRTTPEGRILDVNPALVEVLGYPDHESLLRVNAGDLYVNPEERARWRALMDNTTVVRNFEMQLRRADGANVWVRHSARAILNDEGKVLCYEGALEDITERRQAEDSRARLAAIVESSDDAIIGKSLDGIIFSWNSGAQQIYGYSAEEMMGKSISVLVPADHSDEISQILERIRQGEPIEHYETVRLRKDGQKVDVSLTTSPIRDATGRIVGISTIAHDITERKRMEEKLRTAALYARSLIEASLDPLVTISPEGKITDVNKATELVTGQPRDYLIGSDFSDYFTEPEKAREGYQKVLSEGLVKDYPLTIRHISGRITDVLYNATAYRNEAGEMQGVFAAARDISGRKRAEEERNRLFNLSLDMLCIAGFDGYFKQLNPAWQRTLGWTNEELMSKPYLEFVHPDDREPTVKAASGLSEGEVIITFDNRYLCKDGSYKWISWNSVPLIAEGLIFAVARDTTDIKRAEKELKRLNTELEDHSRELEVANQELEAFSYSVSHDLRVPLRAIDGFSLILLDDYAEKVDDEGKRMLRVVRNNTKKMGQLIEDLLAFSRVGRKEMTPCEINMEGVARAAFEEIGPVAAGRQVQLEVGSLPPACGDQAMIGQVFLNLLSNAVKFTRPRETAAIEVGGKMEENENIYYVKDNGVGFDMRYVDKLFGMFQRLHSQEEFEGTGIGLAIVQRIIHKHGGRVWAEGEVDKGAVFYFTLPRKEGVSSFQSTINY